MTKPFAGIKVGDRVWSVVYGWGEVTNIHENYFPIEVRFDSGGRDQYLTTGVSEEDQLQTLFWDEVKITPPPKPKRMCSVKMDGYTWKLYNGERVFSAHPIAHDCVPATLTWEEEE